MTEQAIAIPPSSHIASVSYDPEAQELEIGFKDGARYIYSDVPNTIATGFSSAISAGRYFNQMVRDRFDFRSA